MLLMDIFLIVLPFHSASNGMAADPLTYMFKIAIVPL